MECTHSNAITKHCQIDSLRNELIDKIEALDSTEQSVFNLILKSLTIHNNDRLTVGLIKYLIKLQNSRHTFNKSVRVNELAGLVRLESILDNEERDEWSIIAYEAAHKNDCISINELIHVVNICCAA